MSTTVTFENIDPESYDYEVEYFETVQIENTPFVVYKTLLDEYNKLSYKIVTYFELSPNNYLIYIDHTPDIIHDYEKRKTAISISKTEDSKTIEETVLMINNFIEGWNKND